MAAVGPGLLGIFCVGLTSAMSILVLPQATFGLSLVENTAHILAFGITCVFLADILLASTCSLQQRGARFSTCLMYVVPAACAFHSLFFLFGLSLFNCDLVTLAFALFLAVLVVFPAMLLLEPAQLLQIFASNKFSWGQSSLANEVMAV
eukprot:GILK01009430.1.p1 GENE.GILK01009430.1~~GILK01009430.1.p1  ORF type:complete len:161 (-),score=13.11 GILK01009430.1:17-463(-)